MIEQLVFYSLAAVAVLSALGVVTMKNSVHSALMLGLALAAVAGVFALLGADFLFAGQVLIYVSGIAVLIMFVVMLLGRTYDLHLRQVNNQWLAGLLICGITFSGLWRVIGLFSESRAHSAPVPGTRLLGRLLMSDYALPFELISLILMASLLGAVYFSRSERSQSSSTNP
ncbi:MAG: NADH-quinone oxidoreductase subunit J [Elusimicrobia bacterium]|nr:NADH-quinone oxidoreductase subunit J [Elusimicrobiota bacterium]